MDPQRLPLPKHGRVEIRLLFQLFFVDEKIQRPGDIEPLFRLDLPDHPGAFRAAVVAQIDAEGGDDVLVHVGNNTLDKVIIRALLILQHSLRMLEQPGLEAAVGKLQPQVDQVAGGPFRGFLDIL